MYDLVIIGSGPAGLTAAIYMARARYRVLVVEKENTGGQITITSEVVNYPGILSVSGKELTATMKIQADSFGAEFAKDQITGIQKQDFYCKGNQTGIPYACRGDCHRCPPAQDRIYRRG